MSKNNYSEREPVRKKKKRKKMKWLIALEVLVILLLIAFVYIYIKIDRIPKAELNTNNVATNNTDLSGLDGYRNIAIFGVDSRANDLKENTRSDSIMIASINRKTKDVKLVSLFRDTYVNVPGHGYTKLTHAYAYGGPELALSTINKNFDLNIKEFVTVNFSAVSNVIDELGGITLDITDAELKYVNGYTKDLNRINKTNSPYLKSAGTQTVNGTQATAYSRVRYTAGGDFKRAERQRTVVNKILEKAKKTNVVTLSNVMDEMIPQIYTSLDTLDILNLSKDVFFYSIKEQQGFPFENGATTYKGVSYVFPKSLTNNVSELHKFLFGTEDYKPSSTVQSYSNDIAAIYK
ncbi:LCP family protein [Anaeromicropila herbilytica]|uniref:LytR family transcriptional regulator n=1 Tax=Anaeromicropila herbilytica TaxID=2785025 RepID=A0A7R7EJD0_9FIRM|nr:LCP family protein [Anaeromicropila herbilytica]BCN29789.1 LytR family transcriptional regulator [Anaeromicropila herbilytica]